MSRENLFAHLATGATHVCNCWLVTRADGRRLGFTDHDCALSFDGIGFAPSAGLSARALASTSGLSLNNTEALGVLSDAAITEADIMAGRYDRAEVTIWRVCWDDVSARQLRFRGHLGEITRAGGGFEAELTGLTDLLNQPQGRSYLKTCSAVLGDGQCRFDISDPLYRVDLDMTAGGDGQNFAFAPQAAYPSQWFEHGLLEVLSGPAQGLRGAIRTDLQGDLRRDIVLWAPLAAVPATGDRLRLTAGCDKSAEACRTKFSNFLNFQGFPDIPGDDWLVSVPRAGQSNFGRSLTR